MPESSPWTRRRFMFGAAAAAASFRSSFAQATDARYVTLDAALTQSMLALGLTPLATTNRTFYERFVIEPSLPTDIVEFGLRAEPNLELLWHLRPEQIFYSPEFGELPATMKEIASLRPLPIYGQDGDTPIIENAVAAIRSMGEAIHQQQAAYDYIAQFETLLANGRERLGRFGDKSFCLFTFLTDRRVRIYTARSLLSGVLDRFGIGNVVGVPGNRWGSLDLGMELLAEHQADRFIHIGDISQRTQASPVWNALPFVKEGLVSSVPTNWMFGGLPSAERFARTLVSALAALPERRS